LTSVFEAVALPVTSRHRPEAALTMVEPAAAEAGSTLAAEAQTTTAANIATSTRGRDRRWWMKANIRFPLGSEEPVDIRLAGQWRPDGTDH
jgi:hypothetical protein